jgi:hypothetical protein
MRIPLRKQFGVNLETPRGITIELRKTGAKVGSVLMWIRIRAVIIEDVVGRQSTVESREGSSRRSCCTNGSITEWVCSCAPLRQSRRQGPEKTEVGCNAG